MSLITDKYLVCDGVCDTDPIGVDNRQFNNLKALLMESKDAGWKRIKGRDFCEKCKPHKKTTP